MRFCYNCGDEVRDGQKFCSGCGADISSPPPGSAPAASGRVPVTAAPPVVTPAPASSTNKMLIIAAVLGIGIIMLIVVAIVGMFVVMPMVVMGANAPMQADETVHVSDSSSTSNRYQSSPLELIGNTYATGSGGKVTSCQFSVALAPGAVPVDFEDISVVFSTANDIETLRFYPGITSNPSSGTWAISDIRNDAGSDNLILEQGEQFNIVVKPSAPASPNERISIELKPSSGVSLGIVRTIPAAVQSMNILY